jgi:hypothetical protein
VVVIRLIYVLECLQAPLARTLRQIASPLFRCQTYPWGHVSYNLSALLQSFQTQDGVRIHRLFHYWGIQLLEVEIMTTFISILKLILMILISQMLSESFCNQVI